MLPKLSVHQAPEAERVAFLQFIRQRRFGKVLVTKWPDKALDGTSANRRRPPVSRGRVGAPVIHCVTNFDTGWEAIANQSSDFGFQQLQKIAVGRKIFRRPMNCGGQLSFKFLRGTKQLL